MKGSRELLSYAISAVFSVLALTLMVGNVASAAERPLTFTSYGSAYQRAQTEAWVKPFAQNHGINFATDAPTNYAKIKSMVKYNHVTWDVVDTEPFFPPAFCGKYLEKLDFSIIDTSDLPSEMVGECSVPDALYSLVLVYNKNKYDSNPPDSFEDFFNTKRFPGVRMLPGFVTGGPLEVALLGDGVDPKNLYPLDYKRAFDNLDTIRSNLIFWSTSAESVAKIENSQVDMALVWSGRIYEAVKNGAPYEAVWKDNLLTYATLSVLKGSPNKELAMQMINYSVKAEPQEEFAERTSYSPVNKKAKPDLSSLARRFDVSRKEIRAKSVTYDAEWWAQNYKKATQKWTSWKTK